MLSSTSCTLQSHASTPSPNSYNFSHANQCVRSERGMPMWESDCKYSGSTATWCVWLMDYIVWSGLHPVQRPNSQWMGSDARYSQVEVNSPGWDKRGCIFRSRFFFCGQGGYSETRCGCGCRDTPILVRESTRIEFWLEFTTNFDIGGQLATTEFGILL